MNTKQRIALVTGANKGIGFEIVRQLAREGFRVFLGARNEEAGSAAAEKLDREAKEEARAEGRTDAGVTFIKIDITNVDTIRRAVEEFSKQSDRLDALVNNAGILAPAYCISKTALNGVTVQLAAALPKFAINSVCPGWVRTDMGGSNATRLIAEGASGIVWLAADAPQNQTGKFWRDRKVIPW